MALAPHQIFRNSPMFHFEIFMNDGVSTRKMPDSSLGTDNGFSLFDSTNFSNTKMVLNV